MTVMTPPKPLKILRMLELEVCRPRG